MPADQSPALTSDAPANHLGGAQSAYLQSAAHQPIHWFPWGAAAFETARRLDRPILLDIGAVWCHWCHVMDGESYEDPKLAEFINQHFVCIKVDRDERPDVDARYQRAIQAISGQGGWPLTAFLTPSGDVFYGGTYFPPDGKFGRPGFRTVLEQVSTVYHAEREKIGAQAEAVRRVLTESLDEGASGPATAELLDHALESIASHFDFRHGGFGTQPKFPQPAAMVFLLYRYHRQREPWIREIIDRTLQGMARGGIHDQLGGGFHRYSVDARWIVPHFEKMSYDNAELLKAYLEAYAAFGTEEYAEVARGIVRWVREVLADPEGGYGASQDADVGLDDDGDYFTWTRDEAAAVLTPEELDVAAAYYDIGTAGEMHHNPAKNVLYLAETPAAIASRLGITIEEVLSRLESAKLKLTAARAARPAPFVDRTQYANWNAMLVSALLRAGVLLDDAWASGHALATLGRIRRENPEPDAVRHTTGGIAGLLDDQVQVAQAALDAYEATAEPGWLEWSRAIMERVWRDYHDAAGGGLFDRAAADSAEGLLPTRAKPVQDAPTPSPNGTALLVCARLFELLGDEVWRERRDELVTAFAGRAHELGFYGSTFLLGVDWALNPSTHFVIVEDDTGAGQMQEGSLAERMHREALRTFAPRRVVQRVHRSDPAGRLPAAVRGMLGAAGGTGTLGFICIGATCQAPVADMERWQEGLRSA